MVWPEARYSSEVKEVGTMKAIGFDLGETLIYYSKVPGGSFKEHFRTALIGVCTEIGVEPEERMLQEGERILAQYNTRSSPREHEVKDTDIFRQLLTA